MVCIMPYTLSYLTEGKVLRQGEWLYAMLEQNERLLYSWIAKLPARNQRSKIGATLREVEGSE